MKISKVIDNKPVDKIDSHKWSTNLLGVVGKEVDVKYFNYYDHYQHLLPMIESIFEGKNIISKYNQLEKVEKLVVCMIACARLIDRSNESQESATYVANFLKNVSLENAIVAIRSQIQLERLVVCKIFDNLAWGELMIIHNNQI